MLQPDAILSGLKVVELATYIFAPASAAVLGDFGAQVIKIERPGSGDTYRQLFSLRPMPRSDMNYCFLLDGRNKRSIALDVAAPEGREALKKLLADADVFVTNYRPGILSKLGLSYEALQADHPRLIYAHATGFGEDGEKADKAGFDQTAYWAASGLMFALHNADADPCPSVCGMGDHPSAMALFGGIMLALYARERTGRGTKVSSSLMANGFWSNSCQIQAAIVGASFYERRQRATMYNPLVNHYVSRDGKRFIFCLIHPERDWTKLCQAIEMPELEHDARFLTQDLRSENGRELIAIIDRAISKRDLSEWKEIFARFEMIWNPVSSVQELAADKELLKSDFFIETDHPRYGPLKLVDSPIRLRDASKVTPRPAPEIGQHTREILSELGYTADAIERMLASGVVSSVEESAGV